MPKYWNLDPDIQYDIRIHKNRYYSLIIEDNDITADWEIKALIFDETTGTEVVSFNEAIDVSGKRMTISINNEQTADVNAGASYLYEVQYKYSATRDWETYQWGYVQFSDTAP